MNNSEIINETIEEKMEKYLNDYKNGLNTEIQEKMNKEWNINCSFKYCVSLSVRFGFSNFLLMFSLVTCKLCNLLFSTFIFNHLYPFV